MPPSADDQPAAPWFSDPTRPTAPPIPPAPVTQPYLQVPPSQLPASQLPTAPTAPAAPAAPAHAADPGRYDPFPPHQDQLPQPERDDVDLDPVDDELFERVWDKPRRTNRWTALLVAGIVAVAGFIGGVMVQKKNDEGLTSSAAGVASALRSRASAGGFSGAGGFGGSAGGFGSGFGAGPGTGANGGAGGAAPSGAGGAPSAGAESGAGGAQAGGAQAGAGQATSDVPVVVGTVASISGTTLVVKNFADVAVTVHVPSTATVTTPGLTGLRVGATVSVIGTKAADGSVAATSVVSRAATG